MLKRSSSFVALLLVLSSSLFAQVVIDVAKITCHQFATYKVAHPDKIAIWLNGYFHGKRGDLMIDTQELGDHTDKVQETPAAGPCGRSARRWHCARRSPRSFRWTVAADRRGRRPAPPPRARRLRRRRAAGPATSR